jgi:hypothetical protein
MLSGKGLFGNSDLMSGLGGMGMGGLLGMLLGKGQGGGDDGTMPGVDLSGAYPGMDPMLTEGGGPGMGGAPQSPQVPRFGRFGNDIYFGGRNPIGQNAIGKFLGGIF